MQRVPYRINPRRNTLRHILVKLTEIKHKERILKAAREKQQVTYKGNPTCLRETLYTFSRNSAGEKGVAGYISIEREESTWQGSHSELMEKSKGFQTNKS